MSHARRPPPLQDAIRDFFSECGEIASVRVATDRDTGRSKGFAHIDFETPEGAAKVGALRALWALGALCALCCALGALRWARCAGRLHLPGSLLGILLFVRSRAVEPEAAGRLTLAGG